MLTPTRSTSTCTTCSSSTGSRGTTSSSHRKPSELGWKETVRVSPLEDTIVALRPIVPTLPFGVPDSKRALNPAMPLHAKGDINSALGTQAGFNNTDVAGNPMATPISNEITDFGWEYVFHCHILSHEEMDMMRPVTVHVPRAFPTPPVAVGPPGTATWYLKWTDGTPVNDESTRRASPGPIRARPRSVIESSEPSAPTEHSAVDRHPAGEPDELHRPPPTSDPDLALPGHGLQCGRRFSLEHHHRRTPVVLEGDDDAVTTSRNPSTFGQSVTFTATVRSTHRNRYSDRLGAVPHRWCPCSRWSPSAQRVGRRNLASTSTVREVAPHGRRGLQR